MDFLLRILKKKYKLIADIRDQLLPEKKINILDHYQSRIACSKNIINYYEKNGYKKDFFKYIPVPQENLKKFIFDESFIKTYNLQNKKYILYAGLIKKKKGLIHLIKSFNNYKKNFDNSCFLVIAGYIKDHSIKSLLENKNIIFLGDVPRNALLNLIYRSIMCIHLSESEGIPRFCLESIALRKKILLPKGIPEFENYMKRYIVKSSNPELTAKQINDIITTITSYKYPIEIHDINKISLKYFLLIEELKNK
jgi:glycosyltransferase involved in cell wall biosynthesis